MFLQIFVLQEKLDIKNNQNNNHTLLQSQTVQSNKYTYTQACKTVPATQQEIQLWTKYLQGLFVSTDTTKAVTLSKTEVAMGTTN